MGEGHAVEGKAGVLPWGGAGQANVPRPIIEGAGHRIRVVYDRDPDLAPPFAGVPVISSEVELKAWLEERRDEVSAFAVAADGQERRSMARGAGPGCPDPGRACSYRLEIEPWWTGR